MFTLAQPMLPEIQAVIDNRNSSLSRSEKELEQLAEARKQKDQVRDWKKALKALSGKGKSRASLTAAHPN